MEHEHGASQAMAEGRSLSRNEKLVHGVLMSARKPLSAYTILDALRPKGFKAPLQVYRALDRLVGRGLAHRLESLNSFVACRHPGCGAHEIAAFSICESCGRVREYSDHKLAQSVEAIAGIDDFEVKQTVIELRGTCSSCTAKPNN